MKNLFRNELRIGNIVGATLAGNAIPNLSSFDNEILLKHGFIPTFIESGVDIDNSHWYFRMPLDSDWLVSFGFENWGELICNEYEKYDRWVLDNVVDGTSNFEVHIIHSNYGGVYHREIYFSIDNDERQFIHNTEFVHNLQNAYYLCTGNELICRFT